MATRPLPTIATDPQGRPVKQDSGEALLKHNAAMADIQKIQLDILTDLLGVMKNIAENVIFIYKAVMKSIGEYINPPEFAAKVTAAIEKSRGNTKNKLAEAEKEREGKLGTGAAKPESLLDSLKKLFDEYFGIFKTVFNVLRLILLPLVFGFIIGFRKKFDLFTVALGIAIMYPIRTFKFMVKVFGFLFETLKSIGKLISKIGPVFQDAVQGITNFFRRMRIFFLRTLDLGKILQPIRALFSGGAGIFQGLAKVLGGIFRVFGKLFIPLTIIMAVYDGIMGAIEGYKEGGIMGAVQGALVGILDGLIGWLVGIGQWIVSNLLELFGFDELAKAVDEFNFKEFLKKYISFLSPFTLLLSVFDENSPIRKQFSAALDKISNVGDFVESIWDSITEALRNMLIKIGEAIPGGSALLKALGIKAEQKSEPIKNFERGRDAAVQAAIEDGKSEEEIQAIRNAKNEEELRAATQADLGDKAKSMATNPLTYFGPLGATISAIQSRNAKSEEILAAEATNKAEDIDKKTRDAETAKKPEPPKPTQNNTTVVNAPNNSKTTANMNPAPHADKVGIGSRGNAAYAGFGKSY
jgi:hypothetical protein